MESRFSLIWTQRPELLSLLYRERTPLSQNLSSVAVADFTFTDVWLSLI